MRSERINHGLEAQRLIDNALAEQDADFERLEAEALAKGLTNDEANKVYWNWIHKIASEPVTEADVSIEGSPDIVIYDPNQYSLFD